MVDGVISTSVDRSGPHGFEGEGWRPELTGYQCNSSPVLTEVLPTECGGLPQFDSQPWEG